jgi:hypothetical protein
VTLKRIIKTNTGDIKYVCMLIGKIQEIAI